MTRILLVDDHAVVRQGVRQILAGALPGAEFADAASAEDAAELAASQDLDLVIVDVSLPGRSGLDLLKDLQRIRPRVPALVLSMYPEEQLAVRALRAGAAGYVTKRSAAAELVTAVKSVLAGRRYVSATLAERLADQLSLPPGRAPHELLSDREFEVFRLLASGRTVTASAAALGLSVPTVSTYRARILEKMGLQENYELIQYAIHNRLLE